jgi:hypothetical protein
VQNRQGVRFCEDCGARLALTCPSCGAELLPEKKFCGSCGAPAAGQPSDRFPSPQADTPKHIAEKILTSKSALEGERKQVTVLFAGLKGLPHYRQALALADELGMRPLLAHCHLGLGKLEAKAGPGAGGMMPGRFPTTSLAGAVLTRRWCCGIYSTRTCGEKTWPGAG